MLRFIGVDVVARQHAPQDEMAVRVALHDSYLLRTARCARALPGGGVSLGCCVHTVEGDKCKVHVGSLGRSPGARSAEAVIIDTSSQPVG
jgi:hypothetical protein